MKILVGNNALNNPGGSETYTYTLIEELTKRNHDVICISPSKGGMVTRQIRKLGVDIINKPIKETFDLLLMSHNTSIRLINGCKGFKVQTCHGIYPRQEQPVLGMDAYVSISEEVKMHLLSKNIKSTIIRNGVNCQRFSSSNEIGDQLHTILSFSHSNDVNEFLSRMCDRHKYNLIIKNKYKHPIWNVESLIDKADLVVTLGRGCYESMAMGRNVFIYDNRLYSKQGSIGDGIVTKKNILNFLKNNCSGRYSKRLFTEEQFLKELNKYSKRNGEELKKFTIENLNIKTQVDKYLELVQ